MPSTYEASFTPRYFECEPRDGLHDPYYARYVMQFAMDASEGAPDEVPRLRLEPDRWQLIDFGVCRREPIRFGDQLAARARLGRASDGVWRWEVTLSRAGQPIVEGFAAWTRAAETDDELLAGYEARLAALPARPALPAWDDSLEFDPEPPRDAFEADWRVTAAHLDATGDMDPAMFLPMLHIVHANAAASDGWDEQRLQAEGLAWQWHEFRLEMLTGLGAGQEVSVISYLGETSGAEMTRHDIVSLPDNQVAAFARTRWRCLDAASGAPRDIPAEWLFDLGLQMADLRDRTVED